MGKLLNKPARIVNKRDLAESFALMGFDVFACAPNCKEPHRGSHGLKDATQDLGIIRAWWKAQPKSNPAIRTGGSNRVNVLDVEKRSLDWIKYCPVAEHLIELWQVRSGGGGVHFYFRLPDGISIRNSASDITDGVDTRGTGGYAIAPGSVVDGNEYQIIQGFEEGSTVDDIPLADPELIAFLQKELGKSNADSTRSDAIRPSNSIPEGQRNHAMTSLAGTMRRAGMGYEAILAALREENNRCVPPLDDSELVKIANSVCRYEPDTITVAVVENHWAQMVEAGEIENTSPKDPGPIPSKLLCVPGFISDVMNYNMANAPTPNEVLAFCGALVMQSLLMGRKVCGPNNARANIYLLALGESGSGKDFPRSTNVQIARQCGFIKQMRDKFASSEGIEDALADEPCLLFQNDELDALLQSINKAKDTRFENIMGTLLQMYSCSGSVYAMRVKAGTSTDRHIDQPFLSLFGTAIAKYTYSALSERMLTNGFFNRLLVFESGERQRYVERETNLEIPSSILDVARIWKDKPCGNGNLSEHMPNPQVVGFAPDAIEARKASVEEFEDKIEAAREAGDDVRCSLYKRATENATKLTMIYAASANYVNPVITTDAIEWAHALIDHMVRRMSFMSANYGADSWIGRKIQSLKDKLRKSKGKKLGRSAALKHLDVPKREFDEIIHTMGERGEIMITEETTKGRPRTMYELIGD